MKIAGLDKALEALQGAPLQNKATRKAAKYSVTWIPQVHNTLGVKYADKESKDMTIRSQHYIARTLCKGALDIPRNVDNISMFLRRNRNKILYVFHEGSEEVRPLSYNEVLMRYRGRWMKKAMRLFPKKRIPKDYRKLSKAQRDFLYKYGGAGVAVFLQKAVWIKKIYDKKLYAKAIALNHKYAKKYISIFSSTADADTAFSCIKYGRNPYREAMYDKREDKAVSLMEQYLSLWAKMKLEAKYFLIFGASHAFARTRKSFKLKIPASYAPIHKEIRKYLASRQYCNNVVGKRFAEYLINAYDFAERAPHKKVQAVKSQSTIIDFLDEANLKVLGAAELLSIIDGANYKRALKSVDPDKVVKDLLAAITFFGRILMNRSQ